MTLARADVRLIEPCLRSISAAATVANLVIGALATMIGCAGRGARAVEEGAAPAPGWSPHRGLLPGHVDLVRDASIELA